MQCPANSLEPRLEVLLVTLLLCFALYAVVGKTAVVYVFARPSCMPFTLVSIPLLVCCLLLGLDGTHQGPSRFCGGLHSEGPLCGLCYCLVYAIVGCCGWIPVSELGHGQSWYTWITTCAHGCTLYTADVLRSCSLQGGLPMVISDSCLDAWCACAHG